MALPSAEYSQLSLLAVYSPSKPPLSTLFKASSLSERSCGTSVCAVVAGVTCFGSICELTCDPVVGGCSAIAFVWTSFSLVVATFGLSENVSAFLDVSVTLASFEAVVSVTCCVLSAVTFGSVSTVSALAKVFPKLRPTPTKTEATPTLNRLIV